MPFDFNLYSSLLIPPFLHGILFAILLFIRGRREERLADTLLAWILVINVIKIAFWMLGFAGWYDGHDGYTSFMFYFPFNNLILSGPLVYFYFLSLTNSTFRISVKHWPHFILPAAYLVLIISKALIDYSFNYPFPNDETTQYGSRGPLAELDKSYALQIVNYISFGYYLWKTRNEFATYQKYILENFSSISQISFDWLRKLIYVVSTGVIIFFVFDLISVFQSQGNSFRFEWYAYAGLGILVYYLSIVGYFDLSHIRHQLQFTSDNRDITPNTKFDGNVMEEPHDTGSPDTEFQEKLKSLMNTQELYLQPELSLNDLSRHLKMNPSQLSKMINTQMRQNFNDFVNEYRVKSLIQKLKAGEHVSKTLLSLAYECGFNSKATFNRAFKKVNGKSPKEFLDDLH
ncbi:MAG: helix-turn-helix transcriptional regulator [Saprospiraceae bacterium]|nr:helix-turn-helix transcriptional regulator [Saprospiraceae bacterium]